MISPRGVFLAQFTCNANDFEEVRCCNDNTNNIVIGNSIVTDCSELMIKAADADCTGRDQEKAGGS